MLILRWLLLLSARMRIQLLGRLALTGKNLLLDVHV